MKPASDATQEVCPACLSPISGADMEALDDRWVTVLRPCGCVAVEDV